MYKKIRQKNLLNHSKAKIRLLGEYLKRYLNIICNDGYTKEINIYDLFCGEGLYENEGEGSPLVILREIKDVHFINVARSNSILKINCYFNDIDSLKIEKVKSAVNNKSLHYKRFGDIHYSSIDYNDILNQVCLNLKNSNGAKSFIFIDPYDYKHIKINHIKNLLKHNNAEVLLWLPTQFMYRFETNGTPSALKDFIEEIVPYEEWNSSDSVWSFIKELKNGFQTAIGRNYFVDHFTIKKDNNTVYCLFFFTTHIKGFEKMLETKWSIDTEQGKGWNYSGDQRSLFDQQRTNPLETMLSAYLTDKKRTNGNIYEFTLRNGYLPKHTNEILYNWQKNGNIDVKLQNGENARKRSFYISYKYFYNDFSKVNFIIK